MQLLGCLGIIALTLAVGAGINALIAIPVTWALNSFTQLHPSYLTVFIVLWIASLLFGSGARAAKR